MDHPVCFLHPTIRTFAGPLRQALLIHRGRVVGFQPRAGCRQLRLPGAVVLPAFADAHLHLLPLIERVVGVDCRDIRSLSALLDRLRNAPGEGWVRATGYDLGLVHPSREELDRAVPHRPVRLLHRTGHLVVMNSLALRAIPPPLWEVGLAAGWVEQDSHGCPTGRLWEPASWLAGRVLPPLSEAELRHGLAQLARDLFAWGVTTVHDASPTNDAARLALWQRLDPPFRLLFLPGEHFSDPEGAAHSSAPARLRLGPTKLLLPDQPRELPSLAELCTRIRAVGRPVAIHAVVHQAVRLAVEAVAATRVSARIEHAAEWPPDLTPLAQGAPLRVVVHPGWLRERAGWYRDQVAPELLPWLHRGRSFLRAGIPMLFGSDAPAGTLDPLAMLAGAVTRRGSDGTLLTPTERLTVGQALRALMAGRADLDPASRDGALRRGALADFVVLDRDPFVTPPAELATIQVLETYRAGERVWPPE
jgi:predicted amidohydrolase YtcJ